MIRTTKQWVTPGVVLALGLGTTLGAILASGLHITGEDSARFLGGILGSLIAVSGAIILFYLKERHDAGKITVRVNLILKKLEELCESTRAEIERESDMNITMFIVLEDYYKRAVELIGHSQFDDYAIAECYYSLTKFGGKTLYKEGLELPKPPQKKHLLAALDYYQSHVNNALLAMQLKPSRSSSSIFNEGLVRLKAESPGQ